MHRSRSNFGKAFEDKCDFKRAIEAYKSAGLEDDVRRVGSKIATLELARKLEEQRYWARAVDALLEGGLAKEAGELAQRIEKAETPESFYVKVRMLACSGDIAGMERPFRKMVSHGARGKYLFAMALSDTHPHVSRRIADELSGREPNQEREDAKGYGVFIVGNASAEDVADHMLAMTFWGMQDSNEMVYFALRIYRKLGDEAEAGRCLEMIEGRGDKYMFYAALAKGGPEAVVESGLTFDFHRRLALALTRGHAGAVVRAIEGCTENSAEERCQYASELLGEIDKYVPELLHIDAVETLLAYSREKKEELGAQEKERLDQVQALIDSGEFERIVEAKGIVGKVRFQYTRSRYWDYMNKCAEAAFRIGSDEALKFAGEIYHSSDKKKAMECADRLLEAGAIDSARELYGSIASSVHYSLHSDRKHEADDTVNLDLNEQLLGKAFQLEQSHGYVSLAIYMALYEREGVVRIAKAIVKSGSVKELEMAAWAVSIADKKSLLMRDLLLKLEDSGEEGRKKAQGIRLEMKVPGVFVAQ